MTVAEKLKCFRIVYDYKLKEVAERTGLSITYISDTERGVVNPSTLTLAKFAKCYNVTLSKLLAGVSVDEILAQVDKKESKEND